MIKEAQKKWYFLVAAVTGLLIGGVTAYALHSSPSTADIAVSSPAHPEKPQQISQTPAGQPITEAGTVECLTPSSAASTQATTCALGLKGDDGKSYAITSADPLTTGSLPTGAHVRVTGTVTQQTTPYDIAGIIQVDSVQHL